MDVDLFGHPLPAPPPVPEVTFHEYVRWERIVTLSKPACGHCQMVAGRDVCTPVLRATVRRIGVEGAVLDLCEQHTEHQKRRDHDAS